MAVSATCYVQTTSLVLSGGIAFGTDPLKLALATASYQPNLDTDANLTALQSFQPTGGGYTAGGVALSNVQAQVDVNNNWTVITCDPVTFSALSATVRYAVVYKVGSGNPLIGLVDFGQNVTYTNEDVTLTFTNGILRCKLPS